MAGLGIFAMKFYVNSWSPRSTSHNIQNVRLFGPRRSWFGHSIAMAKTAPLRSNNFWNCLAANCDPWWVWVFFGTPKVEELSYHFHTRITWRTFGSSFYWPSTEPFSPSLSLTPERANGGQQSRLILKWDYEATNDF